MVLDFPNSWPQHIYFALEGLANLPPEVTGGDLPLSNNSFTLMPTNQLGLTEDKVPLQPLSGGGTAPRGSDINTLDRTVTNGGNKIEGEGWAAQLQRELANRYIASVFCSWYATGGALPGLLPRLPDAALNLTHSANQTGHLFEKLSAVDVDSSGSGGEYVIQAGFGWTNGVALWIGAKFKDVLVRPNCPTVAASSALESKSAVQRV
jgi:alpha,alpha-trehalase